MHFLAFSEVSEELMQLLQKVIENPKAKVLQALSLPLAIPFFFFHFMCLVWTLVHVQCVLLSTLRGICMRILSWARVAMGRKWSAQLRYCHVWEFEDKIFRCVSFFLDSRAY